MAIYKGSDKVAGYSSGQHSVLIKNLTILVTDFVQLEDDTFEYVYDTASVIEDSLIDVYFSEDTIDAASIANVTVSCDAGHIYFKAKNEPTKTLYAETVRIINPCQDDSSVLDTDQRITALQNELAAVNEGMAQLTSEKVNTTDIVDNLTSTQADLPLSANQGKVLNDSITQLNGNLMELNSEKVDKTSLGIITKTYTLQIEQSSKGYVEGNINIGVDGYTPISWGLCGGYHMMFFYMAYINKNLFMYGVNVTSQYGSKSINIVYVKNIA